MREINPEQLGGEGKFVEADETFTGGKAKNCAYASPPPKEAVMALVGYGKSQLIVVSLPPIDCGTFVTH